MLSSLCQNGVMVKKEGIYKTEKLEITEFRHKVLIRVFFCGLYAVILNTCCQSVFTAEKTVISDDLSNKFQLSKQFVEEYPDIYALLNSGTINQKFEVFNHVARIIQNESYANNDINIIINLLMNEYQNLNEDQKKCICNIIKGGTYIGIVSAESISSLGIVHTAPLEKANIHAFEFIKDKDPQIRIQAIDMLKQLYIESKIDIQVLLNLLVDENPYVCGMVGVVLVEIGHAELVSTSITTIIKDMLRCNLPEIYSPGIIDKKYGVIWFKIPPKRLFLALIKLGVSYDEIMQLPINELTKIYIDSDVNEPKKIKFFVD